MYLVYSAFPRLSRGAMEPPSLERHKNHLDLVLCNQFQVTLLELGGWTQGPPEVPSSLSSAVEYIEGKGLNLNKCKYADYI